MKATKQYYLQYRNTFLMLGLNEQVRQLDIHFSIMLVYSKHNQLIMVI